jgi:clan AA aspartic protease
MPSVIGFLNSSGRPAIKIEISGAWPQTKKEIEAVIDTGFSGFLSIPLMQAFPLALPLVGTTNVELADGVTHAKFTGISTIWLGAELQVGIAILEPSSSDVLLGMEFLKTFKKVLILLDTLVVLLDESEVKEVLAKVFKAAQEAAGPPSPA